MPNYVKLTADIQDHAKLRNFKFSNDKYWEQRSAAIEETTASVEELCT